VRRLQKLQRLNWLITIYVHGQAEARFNGDCKKRDRKLHNRASLIAAAMTSRFLRGCRANNSTHVLKVSQPESTKSAE
jgi:hypothetical protein